MGATDRCGTLSSVATDAVTAPSAAAAAAASVDEDDMWTEEEMIR